MRKTSILLLVSILLCLLLTACGSGKIVGTWSQKNGDKVNAMLFKEDGTGSFTIDGVEQYSFTYTLDKELLSLATKVGDKEVPLTYTFDIKGKVLHIINGDGSKSAFIKED